MLPLVETPTHKLKKYKPLISKDLFKEITKLSLPLKGLKIFHINSTPRGGGVAEILKSLVPLMKGMGIDARWYTIPARNNFFEITKKIHNALQGKNYHFPFSARKKYMLHMVKTAELMKDMKADIWVVHDPQPAGIIMFLPNFHPSISRLHIDLTSPNIEVWDFLSGFLEIYDKVILSSKEFIKEEIRKESVIFQPAIDVLSPKNKPLSLNKAKGILESFGINTDSPLIAQVGRFDPWKDTLGVIDAYKLAKKTIPNLQLALVCLFLAQDDPEAERVYKKAKRKIGKDPDIFIFTEPEKLGSLKIHTFVNAVQVASDIILQKSTREGFGMTVAEAMWKGKAVIGGNVGGIKLQIKDRRNGFLVSNYKEAAHKIVKLIKNPNIAKKMGKEAQKKVKEKFLMPRLLKDYLKLFNKLI